MQLTKEYLGFATHLVYLPVLWKEVLDWDTLAKGKGSTVARVIDGSLEGHDQLGDGGRRPMSAMTATGPAQLSIRRTGTASAA